MKFTCGKSREQKKKEFIDELIEEASKYKSGKIKFLWFPTTVGHDRDGYKICRWLEHVHVSYPNACVEDDCFFGLWVNRGRPKYTELSGDSK